MQETSKGTKVADELSKVLVREAVKNPAKMWQFIKEFIDRDEGRTEIRNDELLSAMRAKYVVEYEGAEWKERAAIDAKLAKQTNGNGDGNGITNGSSSGS